ncbi:MAG: L,D-transpeptidase [Gammaproteobacteria bacterium]|nr:L,D-transpeptidase [Gammaproteobacteria bacterium]
MREISKLSPYCRTPIQWFAVILCFIHLGSFPVAAASSYDIEIKKSQRLLIVREGEEVRKVYRIALGRGGPGNKQRLGDRKTPVGTYRVIGFNDRSKFDFFIRLNYPNVKDAFYGLKSAVISRAEFDRIIGALRRNTLPPQDTSLGGAIGIHGIGPETPEKLRIHENLNWTEGCIALKNEEIRDLRPYIRIGTRVVIRE